MKAQSCCSSLQEERASLYIAPTVRLEVACAEFGLYQSVNWKIATAADSIRLRQCRERLTCSECSEHHDRRQKVMHRWDIGNSSRRRPGAVRVGRILGHNQ